MTNKQHTPGPWYFEEEETSSDLLFSVYDNDGTRITESYISEASARLIAAAPELLEALEALANLEVKGHTLVDRLQFSSEGRALSDKITTALAKARGE